MGLGETTGAKFLMDEKLINPTDYMKSTHPEAFDFLIGSGMNLDAELELMVARTEAQGRPHHLAHSPETALLPEDIVIAVIEGPGVAAEMRAEIEALTGRPAVH